ncbi:hypothetical protein CR513_45081, partial [Mucuna pruriens]
MEVTLIRAQIFEDIQHIVELYDYTSISTLVHQASKVESQHRRHGKKFYPTTSINLKGKERKEEKLLRRDKIPRKRNAPFKGYQEEEGHIAS